MARHSRKTGTSHQSSVRPRIVSLAPNATSILVELGARASLVGVSRWCKEVADVGGLPQFGDCWALSRSAGNKRDDVSAIQRLRPDFIIGSVPFHPGAVEELLSIPATFIALNPRSLRDIFRDIHFLGGILGRGSEAATLVRRMQDIFSEIRFRSRRYPRVRVYCEAWSNPRISSPPWVAELAEMAGGRFCVPTGRRVTDSQVARARPDVIVLAWTAAGNRSRPQTALQNPHWQRVPAVKNHRVAVVSDELLNTPGPPLMRGAEALFRALHEI